MRAGIIKDPKDYRWSSYLVYAYDQRDSVTDTHGIYQSLAGDESKRKKKYREFVKGMMETKKALKGEMEKKRVYGSEKFIRELHKRYAVSPLIRRAGRPKTEKKSNN